MSVPGDRMPCVWVVASHRTLANEHGHQCYTVMDESGTRTLANLGLQPVCFPRVPAERIDAMLDLVDGVLLGGSATHVHPSNFGETPSAEIPPYEPQRDALSLALIRRALARRVPLIGFCRASHEINVALGGSLHQSLRRRGGCVRHWEDPHQPLDQQYVERHAVTTVEGGELERITRMRGFPASSLLSQGVCRLGHGLVAEAHADDGLVEAFRWHDADQFAWGFQFHPEWGWRWHPAYGRIMQAYAQACRAYRQPPGEQRIPAAGDEEFA